MIVKRVYCNSQPNILNIPEEMLPKSGRFNHHFTSTIGDNLIEACGRVCYDSAQSEKSRSSYDYHKHINEVKHGSVQEHYVVNVAFKEFDGIPEVLINRPGIYLSERAYPIITANIRAIIEWDNWNNDLCCPDFQSYIGMYMKHFAKQTAPFALSDTSIEMEDEMMDQIEFNNVCIASPLDDEEIFVSFFLSGISRNLTHELVRHKWRTAISQRSTRYVDESDSEWCWHPLLRKYLDNNNEINFGNGAFLNLSDICRVAQEDYKQIVSLLQTKLKEDEGLDSFSARKQARGAARGVLGTCLSTELIFTASLAQWQRIILQRCNRAADAEIRIMCSLVFDQLCSDNLLNRDKFIVEGNLDEGYHITWATIVNTQ